VIYGTGVDIVEIARFDRFVAEGNVGLLERVFTPGERAYCSARRNSGQHYALRFAAKEAFVKALGVGLRCGMAWREIEVVNDELGKPSFLLHGQADRLFREAGLRNAFLALSHDGGSAVATVILEAT
jgi:holo-[acyl-carrier protein] synthase